MKDDAEYAVCDLKNLDDNFKYLKWLFGNPRAIRMKDKETILKMLKENDKCWTRDVSPKRKRMLVKVSGFLKSAECLAKQFEFLSGVIFSDFTVNIIFSILPQSIFYKKINKSESHYRSERNQVFTRSGRLQITSNR